ncbi:MAG: type II secretion system protein [Candidatus Omnitrophota bacterium]
MSEYHAILRTRNRGFTLVETLVVAVVFSFVLAGIGFSFMSGMRIWSRSRNISFPKNNLLLVLEEICSELRQSADITQVGFEGDFYKFSFPVLKGDSAVRMTYEFNRDEKVLLKKSVSLADILDKKEEEGLAEKKMASLDDFSVSYLLYDAQEKTYSWENSWDEDSGVFAAIRLKAKLNDEEFTKTVFLPVY